MTPSLLPPIGSAALATLLTVLPASALSAQALLVLLFGDKFASERVQGGIKFDVVGTTLSGLSSAARLRSWDLGGFLEVKLSERFSIQPEFTFKSPAGARALPFAPTGVPDIDSAFAGATNVSVTRTLGYVTIPILLKLRTHRVGLGLGPQIGYIVRAEDRYTGTVSREDDLSYTVGLWSRVNHWDTGVSAVAEFFLAPGMGLHSMRIRAVWYHAFGDALSDAPGRNDTIGIGFGLPIGGPRQAGSDK
ncbi:MAG TPA: outer membrane beta-barrel protein [Gemmatimonadales bacterium]|nr:outer membrane beta-barrel protein [Gemmatimonadales bacterium]